MSEWSPAAAVDENNPPTPEQMRQIIRVLELKLEVARTGEKKVTAFLDAMDNDGRLRGCTTYHAAHTGRESGNRFQPQNLPRGGSLDVMAGAEKLLEGDLDGFRALMPDGMSLYEGLQTMIRSLLTASPGHVLVVADFGQIEGRGLAYLAGDEPALEVYRKFDRGEGPDPYCVMAASMYGEPVDPARWDVKSGDPDQIAGYKKDKKRRQVGKVPELACGYGAGPKKLGMFAAGVGVNLKETDFTTQELVDYWRSLHEAVAGYAFGKTDDGKTQRKGGFWRDLERAAKRALEIKRAQHVGEITFRPVSVKLPSGREVIDLYCELPSGRAIVYHNATVKPVVPGYCKTYGLPEVPKPTLHYKFRNAKTPAKTYGGKLAENVVQAMCRDKMVAAQIRCEQAGIPIILTVHDELIAEVPEEIAQDTLLLMLQLMTQPEPWLPDFPTAADGHIARRYSKEPPDNAFKAAAVNGEITWTSNR